MLRLLHTCFDEFGEMSDATVINMMTVLRGIGTWTAKMHLIFVLDRQGILSYEDGASLQAYHWLYVMTDSAPSLVKKKHARWKPYSIIAVRYLYCVFILD